MTTRLFIRADALVGSDIAGVAHRMCRLAEQLDTGIVVAFNGIDLRASPGDGPDAVLAGWETDRRLEEAARKKREERGPSLDALAFQRTGIGPNRADVEKWAVERILALERRTIGPMAAGTGDVVFPGKDVAPAALPYRYKAHGRRDQCAVAVARHVDETFFSVEVQWPSGRHEITFSLEAIEPLCAALLRLRDPVSS